MTSIFANYKIKLAVSILLTIFISGCVTVEKKGNVIVIDPWKKIGEFFARSKGEIAEKQTGPKDEALKKYGLEGIRQGLIVENPIIMPKVVKPGDRVKQELQFALLAPEQGKHFNVSENRVLSSSEETMELIKREAEKTQGTHLSTTQFTIPANIDPEEYTITTTLNMEERSKTVSGSFQLKEVEYPKKPASSIQKDEKVTTKTDFVIAGVFALSKEKTYYIQPLVEYRNGKFYSTFWSADETYISEEGIDEARRIKHLLRNTKIYWLYDKGKLVGRFKVTKVTSGIVYADVGGGHIVVAGNVEWEKGYTLKIPEEDKWQLDLDSFYRVKDIVALSRPVNQPSVFLSKKILSKEQKASLDKLLHSTLKNASGPLAKQDYKGIRQVVGKPPNSHFIEVMNLDNDRQPEVYVSAFWDGPEYMEIYINLFATWTGKNWKYVRHSTYIGYESLPIVGDLPFYFEAIGDIDGDGIVELIVNESSGYEVNELILYRMHNKRLEKVLEIGDYGL